MADHQKFADFALRMLKKHGRLVTFQKLSSATLTPTTPWKGNNSQIVTDTVEVWSCFVPAQGLKLGIDFFDEELLKTFTQVCMTSQSTMDLSKMTRILDTDKSYWKIQAGQISKPADTVIMYVFGLTR